MIQQDFVLGLTSETIELMSSILNEIDNSTVGSVNYFVTKAVSVEVVMCFRVPPEQLALKCN